MKKIFQSWYLDIKNIWSNKIIRFTILIFCFIPMIYSLTMIKSSWNPYAPGRMKELPIAFVNDDQGTLIDGKKINIGKQIQSNLKTSKKLGWVFVNDWQGNNGLTNGKYYALIQVPNNFSEQIATVGSKNPQQAVITYQINQKLNAAATKISSEIETSLHEQIRQSLVQSETKVTLKKMNSLASEIKSKKKQILEIPDTVNATIQMIDKEKKHIQSVQQSQYNADRQLVNSRKDILKIRDDIKGIAASLTATGNFSEQILKGEQELQNNLNASMYEQKAEIKRIINKFKKTIDSDSLKKIRSANDDSIKNVEALKLSVQSLNNILVTPAGKGLFRNLEHMEAILDSQKKDIDKLANRNRKGNFETQKRLKRVNTNGYKVFILFQKEEVKNANNLNYQLKKHKTNIKSNATNIKKVLDSLDNPDTNKDLELQNKFFLRNLNKAIKQLEAVKDSLSNINEKNLDFLISVLDSSPKAAKVFANPVVGKKDNIYNMNILGYAVTPFYTTLSIWVGLLLLTTIVSWDYTKYSPNRKMKLNRFERYFGKWLLFISIGVIQTTMILLGELFILGIHPKSILYFCGVMYLVTVTFTTIIYTLVYLFGDLGKVICVLLMLMQIFGTGGMYPLELIPSRLSNLAPFLPFYYAIDSFRDAIAGDFGSSFIFTLIMLIEFTTIFFAISPLRRIIHSFISNFEESFKSANL